MAAVIVAGFSLNLALGRSTFAVPVIYHVHAVTFFAWTGLFVLQTRLAAAAEQPAIDELMTQIESLLGVAGPQALRYADPKRGQRRAMAGDSGGWPRTIFCSSSTSTSKRSSLSR